MSFTARFRGQPQDDGKGRTHVTYWPWTEPSIKRCTCVNKRKNSGSRWELNNNITRRTDSLNQLETRCRICSSLSPSTTHLSRTRNITLSRIKCERYIFYKEVCLFVHWSSSLCLIMFRIYLYMYYGYTTHIWERYSKQSQRGEGGRERKRTYKREANGKVNGGGVPSLGRDSSGRPF